MDAQGKSPFLTTVSVDGDDPSLRLTVRSEGFVEAEEGAGRYDVVHLVPPQPRPDQCAQFKSKKS